MLPINRRALLKYSGVLASTPLTYSSFHRANAEVPNTNEFFESESEFFATTTVESSSRYDTDSDGDLWPSCWADDGHVYTANGDGAGFGLDQPSEDIVVNRLYGTPETQITGDRLASGGEIGNIWADPTEYNRKPTGMVAVDSDDDGSDELYVAVQDLHRAPCPECFNDAPNASISKSEDYGDTWQKTDEPMFTDYRFTTIFFLDYGKSYENVRVLSSDQAEYVYAYGLAHNWRASFNDAVPDPTNLYLARVPKQSIQNRSEWEFFAGTTTDGQPTWHSDSAQREPVLHEERRIYPDPHCQNGPENMTVLSQGSVVYNEPLDRYLYTSWTEYTFEFYEAPEPWGPWKLFMRKDFGGYPWFGESDDATCPDPKNGGYATTIPSKFISEDGTTMWVQSNWFENVLCGAPNYNFSLRQFEVEPFTQTVPSNAPDPTNNLARSATPIEKSAHYGHNGHYNDGVKTHSEDSYDCSTKPLDFWGYTWKRTYNLDRLEYTTGSMFPDGGWFSSNGNGLRVQIRQDFEWTEVSTLSIDPPYPYDDTAGPNKTYTLTFDDTWGDGVRVIGPPGGSAYFTSIAELEVYYDD